MTAIFDNDGDYDDVAYKDNDNNNDVLVVKIFQLRLVVSLSIRLSVRLSKCKIYIYFSEYGCMYVYYM